MYSKILVPIDGSPTAERGLREAIALATALSSKIVLLHVVDDFPYMLEMASMVSYEETRAVLRRFALERLAIAARTCREAGLSVEEIFEDGVTGAVADVIVNTARKQDCELIVMGTHGRKGFNRLTWGSDAELVVRHSHVPVLLVRAADEG